MKKTIAEILIQNFDQNNYATISLINATKESIKRRKKYSLLNEKEMEKEAVKLLQKGKKISNPKKLEKDSEEYKLKQKEAKLRYYQNYLIKISTNEEYKQRQKEAKLRYYKKTAKN